MVCMLRFALDFVLVDFLILGVWYCCCFGYFWYFADNLVIWVFAGSLMILGHFAGVLSGFGWFTVTLGVWVIYGDGISDILLLYDLCVFFLFALLVFAYSPIWRIALRFVLIVYCVLVILVFGYAAVLRFVCAVCVC